MPDTELWTLGYVIVAPRLLTAAELRHILDASHRDNPPLQVTGLLLHCDGTFMQVLEGPPTSVSEIFRRICANPLHTDIHVLFDEPLMQREFGNWSMLCRQVSPDQMNKVARAPAGSSRSLLAGYWGAWAPGAA